MTDYPIKYRLIRKEKHTGAHLGEIITPHGTFPTPMLIPIGTQTTVRAQSLEELKETDSGIVLSSTYRLRLRPSDELVARAGGLHKFMNWDQAILTDSDGFQVYPLVDTRNITEEGVTFENHLNGAKMFLSPGKAISIQNNLGSDIVISFDECPQFYRPYDYVKKSIERTSRWAEYGLKAHHHPHDQGLFGIVRGTGFKGLRRQSASDLISMDFPGCSIGGPAAGESHKGMDGVLDFAVPVLSENKSRCLMGVDAPDSLIDGVIRGVDIFDCVLSIRIAQNGTCTISEGRLMAKNAAYAKDFTPFDHDCNYYTCHNYTHAYIRHLLEADKTFGLRLTNYHNLYLLINLVKKVRQAVMDDSLLGFRGGFFEHYGYNKSDHNF